MTTPPPPPPPFHRPGQPAHPPQPAYQPAGPPRPHVSGLAIAALALGIASVLAAIVGGGVLGIAAIVLGAIALSQMNQNPQSTGGKGFAITGVTTGAVSLPLTLFLVWYVFFSGGAAGGRSSPGSSMGRARELSNRGYCAANIRGILQSCNVYANDNSDDFPIALVPTGGTVSFAGGTPTATTADATIESLYKTSGSRGNMTANLWLLVLKNYTTPKQFLCKSDPNNSLPAQVTSGANYANNFGGVENLSYSFAVPWNSAGDKMGFWSGKNLDSGCPLMADMAPHHGDAITGGPVNLTAVQSNPQAWNSPIHYGDGQNVGFGDAHCEWTRRPDVGQQNDNLWTHNGGGGPSQTGRVPDYGPGMTTGSFSVRVGAYEGGAAGSWDIYMLPVRSRDGKTY